MMHSTSGKVNKVGPASSAGILKSSSAISTVIPTIITTIGVRFICHRDCNGASPVKAENSLECHYRYRKRPGHRYIPFSAQSFEKITSWRVT